MQKALPLWWLGLKEAIWERMASSRTTNREHGSEAPSEICSSFAAFPMAGDCSGAYYEFSTCIGLV